MSSRQVDVDWHGRRDGAVRAPRAVRAAGSARAPQRRARRSRRHGHPRRACASRSKPSATPLPSSMPSPPRTSASSRTRTWPSRCSACRASSINREFGEGERVNLRGTAPTSRARCSTVTPSRRPTGSSSISSPTTRSFNYLMLPSDLIGQVTVYKSPQADLEEGGIGGTIDVTTRNPLDIEANSIFGVAAGRVHRARG